MKQKEEIILDVKSQLWHKSQLWDEKVFLNKKVEILTLRLNFEIKKSNLTLKSHNYEIRSINDNKKS